VKTEAQLRAIFADLATVQEDGGGYDAAPDFHRGMITMLGYALNEHPPGTGDGENAELAQEAFKKLHARAQAIRRSKQ
jgi:hypothetical protein